MRYQLFILLIFSIGSAIGQTPYPPLDSLSIEQVIQGKREIRWNTDYHRDSLDHYQPMKAVRMRDIIRQTGRWYATDNDTVATVFSLDTVYFQGLGGVGVTVVPGQWDTIKIDGSGILGTSWWLSDGTDKPAILADTVLVVGEGCVTVDVIPGGLQDTLKITCLNPDGSETIVTAGTGISVTGVGTVGNPYVVTNTGDLSSSNEIQTLTATGAGPTNYNLNLSLGGGDVTLQEGTNIDLTRSGNTITIAVIPDGDGSSTNEIQTLSAGGAGPTSYTLDLSLSGGSVTLLEGTGIDLTRSGNTITISSTIVDTDTDDQFLTLTGTGPNYTIDIDNGSDIIVAPGSGISLSESPANTLVITNTGDLSNTNELQTLSNSSTATTHTVTLSNSGGSVQLAEGSLITLTTTGTALDGIVTIASTADPSTTNEIQTLTAGGAGPTSYTLDLSLGGGSVTMTEGANIDLTRSGNTITIAVVPDGDGSSTNELQVITATGAGPTSYNINLSLSGGDVTLLEGAGIDLTRTGNTITIASTIVDTDTDDQFLTLNGTGPTYIIDIDNGSDITVSPGSGISLSESPANTLVITNTGDLSNTNELQTLNNTSDATSHTATLSNSGGSIKLVEGASITLTTTGTALDGIVTIAVVPDGDGSATNEIQNLTIGGTGPSYSVDIDLGGTDVTISPGSGISLSESPANTLVITNTGDLSNTNEIQTFTASGAGPSYDLNVSPTGGVVTFSPGTGIFLNRSGQTITISNLGDNDSDPLNEAWTIDADDADTEVITTQTVKFEGAGGITTDYVPATDKLIITGTVATGAETIVTAGTGISVSGTGTSGNPYIVTNTGDLSSTNELQTLNNTSNATTHTATLSNSGGSIQLVEGSLITLTTTGTALDGIVTIASTADPSTTNEIQTLSASGAGPTSYNLDLSLSGGSVTFAEGANIDLTRSGNTITVAVVADGDGSSTNEIQNLTVGGTGPNYSIDIDLGGTDVIIAAGTGISLSESPANTLVITNSGDLSNTNEIQTLTAGGAGPTDYTIDLTSSATSVTLSEGTGINLTRTGNTITIAWTGTTLNGIYGDGTPGSGSSFLPPGGSVVDVDDDDPLIFDLDNASGQYNRMMRFDIAYTSDDAVTDAIAIVTPSDSFKIVSFDQGIQMQYAGPSAAGRGLEIISNTQLHLDADSIRSQASSILDKTQLHYLAGYVASPELTYSKIAGTSNGQIMKWNSAGYWELGTDNAGGSGTVTGTGTATQLAWWSGTSSLSSDAAAYWDNTNKRLGIGAGTSPSSSLDVTKTALGTSQTTTSGIALVNTTAAAVGAQQISPALRWSGNGWKTTATAASQPVEFRAYVTPVQGTANPTGYLGFGSAINGTWTNDRFNFSSNGEMGIGTTNFAGAGTFAKLNVYGGAATDFSPFIFNGFAASQSGGTVWASIANTLTTASAGISINESADINTIRAGIQRFGSTHSTRPNELNIFNVQSAPVTISTNNTVRYTMSNVGNSFQPGKLGAGQSTEAAVTSTIQTNSLGTAFLETVGAPTFDDTKHTVVYTASTNISWTLPTAAGCACAGREYVLHHAGTAGVITLSQSITKGNGGNFTTLNAGEWAHIYYGSSSIRGFKITSL